MPFSEEALERSIALVREIEEQTDRGVAIVGLAWVEEELLAALKAFLADDKKARDRLFNAAGPLGSLSAKIDLALLLGMMSDAITADLHTMRRIRNKFAHSVLAKDNFALSFDSPDIRRKCLALKCVAHEEITVARTAFIRACATLNSDFYFQKFMGGQKVLAIGKIYARIESYPNGSGAAG